MTFGALSGIRVIDFGQYVAGPLAAMLLGDQGAEVIRVDPPGGPRLDTPANAIWQRGKRRIVLDLAQTGDRDVARRLIASADVVIENFRPGVMDRLGLGPAEMITRQPRLVYCSLPGFASDHPEAGEPGWEGIVAAATATYRTTPYGPPGQPVYTAIPISSNFAALLGATATVMALIARERDGLGQRVVVPLYDATFTAIGAFGLRVLNGPVGPGPKDLTGGGHFQAADGRWIQFSTFHPRHLDWFLDGLGLSAWRDEGLAVPERLSVDPARRSELRRRLREVFRTRTAQEWEDLAGRLGCPLALCRTTAEWLTHPHALASGASVEVEDPRLGPTIQPGIPARLDRAPGRVGPRCPLDADRAAILDELAAGARPVTGPAPWTPDSREPMSSALAGLRVIDLTNVLAGPTAGRALTEFGADVVKVNSP
ncbi:MAG TPA: CoA transferase, partial [Dehalococcoidia bacterium]|nr:CoA transferase [Dehalococcoidia bacterium]